MHRFGIKEMKRYAITGAANGIGKELALILAQKGHEVIAIDISEPDFETAGFIRMDLSDPESISNGVSEIPEIDGLCNSAGLPPRDGLSEAILKVNFLGTRELTRRLTPKINDGGSIVNLASKAGHKWGENVDQVKRLAALSLGSDLPRFLSEEEITPVRAYDLSKEAMILWTMASSEKMVEQGLRINSISPGAVETAIMSDFEAAFGERMTKNVKRAGRAGRPDEIAHLAAFLLSSKSSWMRGSDVVIDGGMTAFNGADSMDLSGLV